MDTKYYVVVVRNFFNNKITIGFAREQYSLEVIEFDSVEEAGDWIECEEGSNYVLSHNEASRPDMYVVDEEVYNYIESGRNGDMSNYNWEGADCNCGECEVCFGMMLEQDEEYIIRGDISCEL